MAPGQGSEERPLVILNVAGSSIQRVIQQLILLSVQRLVVATPPAPKPPPPALGVPLPEPYEPLWAWVHQQRPAVLDALRAGIAARHGTRSPALAHDDVDVTRPWGDVTVFILRRDGYEPHPLVGRTFVGEAQPDGGSRGPGWVPVILLDGHYYAPHFAGDICVEQDRVANGERLTAAAARCLADLTALRQEHYRQGRAELAADLHAVWRALARAGRPVERWATARWELRRDLEDLPLLSSRMLR